MKKTLLVFSASVFVILVIVTSILYKERVLYVDSAYYAFNMINDEMPVAEHNRYSIYLLQLLPWLMLKSGFAISSVLCVFSSSHILLAFGAFAILIRIHQFRAALLLTLLQVLTFRESFFLALNETSILLACAVLLGAFLSYYKQNNTISYKSFMVYFLIILTGIFCHPMAMILFPFILIYHFIRNHDLQLKEWIFPVTAFVVSLIFKIAVSKSSSYETDLYGQIHNAPEILSNMKNLSSYFFFFGSFKFDSYFFSIYMIPLSVLLYMGYYSIQFKELKTFLFYLVYTVLFWLLITVMFNRGDGNIFMEKNYTPWVFICLYPLINIDFRHSKTASFLFITTILFSCWGIIKSSDIYIHRYQALDHLMSQKNPPKVLIQDSTINHAVWQSTWALPYESLLFCKIRKLPNTTVKVYHNEEAINKELTRNDIFLGADFFPVLPANEVLNRKYFGLEEAPYIVIRN